LAVGDAGPVGLTDPLAQPGRRVAAGAGRVEVTGDQRRGRPAGQCLPSAARRPGLLGGITVLRQVLVGVSVAELQPRGGAQQ